MRARAALVFIAVLLACAPGGARQEPGRDYRFHSAALGREMPYRVLMPAAHATGRRYAVLYLLHGLGGHFDDWTEYTRLADYVDGQDLIVVMPEGANSWYVNWHDGAAERWEDYLARDLVAEVDARFPTDARREGRFIAGLSMGGYGALRLGLKHPDRYAIAASLSGAFDVTRRETYGWNDALRDEFRRTFGPMDSARRQEDDVMALASRATPVGLPLLYIDCGADDPFLPGNREVAAILQRRDVPYEYRETPGRHDWHYWDRQIVEVLHLIDRATR